jgi:hypothetical protein
VDQQEFRLDDGNGPRGPLEGLPRTGGFSPEEPFLEARLFAAIRPGGGHRKSPLVKFTVR